MWQPRFVISALLFGTLIPQFSVVGQTQPKRHPVPDETALAAAREQAAANFKGDIQQANTPEKQLALAQKVFEASMQAQKLPNRFVLLDVCRTMALELGQLDLARNAVDEIGKHFEIDVLDAQADLLIEASQRVRLPDHHKALAIEFFVAIDQATDNKRFDVGRKLAGPALTSVRKARSGNLLGLVRQAADRNDKVAEAHAAASGAIETLKTKPLDPAANLAAGRFYCVVMEDWAKGIPMLALGNDPELMKVAVAELKSSSTAKEKLALGEAWFKLAGTAELAAQEPFRQRALHWYRRAVSDLAGIERAKAEKTISDWETPIKWNPSDWIVGNMAQWNRSNPSDIKLAYSRGGFGFLMGVGGDFAGPGESIEIALSNDNYWQLQGRAGKPLNARATPIIMPELIGRDLEFTEHSWTRGSPPIRLIHKSHGIAFLSRISGNFLGGGESIRLTIGDDGYWYLQGHSAQSSVVANAIAVRIPGMGHDDITVEEFEYKRGTKKQQMLQSRAGFCMLSSIGGNYLGGGEWTTISLDPDGYWYFAGGSGQGSMRARAMAIKFNR